MPICSGYWSNISKSTLLPPTPSVEYTALCQLDFTVHVLPPGNEEEGKAEYVRRLGSMSSICIGNGRNDRFVLGEAGLGIALLQREGATIQALIAADIIHSEYCRCLGAPSASEAYYRHPAPLKFTAAWLTTVVGT